MQAIILAAGMGKRLKELTKDNTKCMVEVNGIRIIDRLLKQLSKFGITHTTIVTGYKGDNLREYVGCYRDGISIDYIDNPSYASTNNIYSLSLAADVLQRDDTLLIESDLVLDDEIFDSVLRDRHSNVAVVDKYASWMDGTCVTIGNDGAISRFIPKRDFVYEDIHTYYKTVNIYKFSKEFSTEYYVPFLRAYVHALGYNEYYEQVLRVISLLDRPLIYAMPLSGARWYEIDDVQDLDIAESMFCSQEEQIKRIAGRFGGYWRYPGIIDFCYLVTPYFPSHRLIDEIKASFNALISQYPSGQRVNSLLASRLFCVKTDEIAVGNGAAEIIAAYMASVRGMVGFVYPTFEEYANRIDPSRRVVFTPSASSGFRYSALDITSFFSRYHTDSLVIVNPDNPSGNFMPMSDIELIAEWCEANGVRLVVDESFADFADNPYTLIDHELLARHRGMSVIKSISKSYGVPGCRLGVIVSADTGFISDIKRSLPIWNINSFGEFFLQIIGKYKEEYRAGCARLAVERNRFISALRQVRYLTVYPSAANYVLCRVDANHDCISLRANLWSYHKILIKDCTDKFGFDGACYVRFAVRDSTDNDVLVRALLELE